MKHIAVILAFMLSGCAFSDVRVNLPGSVSTGYSGGNGRQVVIVNQFKDERPFKEKCGIQKNSYNMETAKAICSMDPSVWMSRIIATELKSAGFSVVTEGEARASALRLDGSLLQIFIEPVMGFTTVTLETDVRVQVVARSETGLLAERSFFVKGTESGLAATSGKFEASFNQATGEIVKEIVAAIISLMNRYPQLGFHKYGDQVIRIALLEENK